MKVLGIIGSPRKNGNTDILVSQILKGVESGGEVGEKIYLDDFQIKACKACLGCQNTGDCIIKDDFHIILNKIKRAHRIIIGSPIYGGTVTAQTKLLIDRVNASQVVKSCTSTGVPKFSNRLKGEKMGVVVCVGDTSPIKILNQTIRIMEAFLRVLGVNVIYKIYKNRVSEKGDILKYPDILKNAFTMGTLLTETKYFQHF
jgi:multimeric flavodoxin WrbA